MEDEFKKSEYWRIFADVVQLMREFYPAPKEDDYLSRIADETESIRDKYRGKDCFGFADSIVMYVVYELMRLYYDGRSQIKQ